MISLCQDPHCHVVPWCLSREAQVSVVSRTLTLKLPFHSPAVSLSRLYRPSGKRKRETLPLTTLQRRSEQSPFAPAEDRATLGSDPSADWSPANGRSGGSSHEGRPASPLPVQGKKAINP